MHLATSKSEQPRRGRPRKWATGDVELTIVLPAPTLIALEMLASYERPHIGRLDRPTMRSGEYVADLAKVQVAERFEDVFGVKLEQFLWNLRAALESGVEPQYAVARVLTNARSQ